MRNSCVWEAVARLRSHLFIAYMFVCVCVCVCVCSMAHCSSWIPFSTTRTRAISLQLLFSQHWSSRLSFKGSPTGWEHLRFTPAGCSDANEGKWSSNLWMIPRICMWYCAAIHSVSLKPWSKCWLFDVGVKLHCLTANRRRVGASPAGTQPLWGGMTHVFC